MQILSRINRRWLLQNSAFGFGALGLSQLSSQEQDAGRGEAPGTSVSGGLDGSSLSRPHFAPRAKNVIFIFMSGGPSHLDLFDPKPELTRLHGQPVPGSFLETLADPVIRGDARCFASPRTFRSFGQSGMQFSDYAAHLGSCADDLCMVRSMYTSSSNHDPGQLLMQCGTVLFGHPCMGSWITYGLGSESKNLPGFIVLLSNSGEGIDGGTALWSNGFLPSSYRGVTLRNQGDPILHLSSPQGVTSAMQRRRLDAVIAMNQQRFESNGDPEINARIQAYELAFRMQIEAPDLVDFRDETDATRKLYGLNSETTRPFGSNCLLARRMVERGVRFVQLYHSTWDDHSDLTNHLRKNTEMTDLPAAGLIRDLKQRGLLEETLVIWAGEFGRTPMHEIRRGTTPGREGRDHHPFGFTVLLAGGGVRAGQVVGKTDDLGYHAVEDRIHVHDLQATILHCLGLDHTRLTFRHQGRDFRLTDVAGNVVEKLLA